MKTCSCCGFPKDVEDFSFRCKATGKRLTKCKACVKLYSGAHYRANKQAYLDRGPLSKKRANDRNSAFVRAYLQAHPCIDCGEADPVVLEFDHVRGSKRGNVSDMVRRGVSLAMIQAEILKCEVRCANDHRRRTAGSRGWRCARAG